jgi:hypothetical protein
MERSAEGKHYFSNIREIRGQILKPRISRIRPDKEKNIRGGVAKKPD